MVFWPAAVINAQQMPINIALQMTTTDVHNSNDVQQMIITGKLRSNDAKQMPPLLNPTTRCITGQRHK
jgi:hypothetical protein